MKVRPKLRPKPTSAKTEQLESVLLDSDQNFGLAIELRRLHRAIANWVSKPAITVHQLHRAITFQNGLSGEKKQEEEHMGLFKERTQ